MKEWHRGVFISHTDFQGLTPQAVMNAKQFAETITEALRVDFVNEIKEAQKAGKVEATLEASELYQQFQEHYKIKVVKVEL